MTLNEIQEEQKKWAAKNFGTKSKRDKDDPLIGINEEYYELIEASHNRDKSEELDAIGDICIYLLDYCNLWGWILSEELEAIKSMPLDRRPIFSWLKEINHRHLKLKQKIRGLDEEHTIALQIACARLWYSLNKICFSNFSKPLIGVVEEVWNKVKERNWKDNPKDGSIINSTDSGTVETVS